MSATIAMPWWMFAAYLVLIAVVAYRCGAHDARPRPKTWGSLEFLKCPHCGKNMVERGLAIGDDGDGVTVRCGWCDKTSLWNFDCPAPYLVTTASVATISPSEGFVPVADTATTSATPASRDAPAQRKESA